MLLLAPASRLGREYVWGPGDSYAGVDELVCQFGGSMDGDGQPSDRSNPWWVIQDLTGDAVAVVEKPSSSQAAAVAWQCTYEPYGGVLACRTLRAHPPLWVGHKGLFADNLDAQVYTALSPQERPVLSARLPLHYHVRNRSLLSGEPVYPSDHPEAGAPRAWAGGMGRFLQPDPHGTGVGVMDHLPIHGMALYEPIPRVVLASWIEDTLHGLAYCAGEPVRTSDPLGLFGFIPGMMTGADMASGALEAMDTAYRGNMLGFGLGQMARGYAVNQEFLVEGIQDWTVSDEQIQAIQADVSGIVRRAYGTIAMGNQGVMSHGDPWWVPMMAGSQPGSAKPKHVRAAFFAAKQHGGDTHFWRMYKDTLRLVQHYDIDPASIQINRAVRDSDGNIIKDKDGRYKRPDVHMRTRDGRVVILEVGVSQSKVSLKEKGEWYHSVLGDNNPYHSHGPNSPLDLPARRRPIRRK